VIHVGVYNFLVVGLFLIIWNALFQVINIEARRNKWHVPAAVSGLHS